MQKAIDKFKHTSAKKRWSGDSSSTCIESTNSLQNGTKNEGKGNTNKRPSEVKAFVAILDVFAMLHIADGQHVYSGKEIEKLTGTL